MKTILQQISEKQGNKKKEREAIRLKSQILPQRMIVVIF